MSQYLSKSLWDRKEQVEWPPFLRWKSVFRHMTCPEPNPNPKVELKKGVFVPESLLLWHRVHFPASLAVRCGHVIECWPAECRWGWGVPLPILHALSFTFCWPDAEEPRQDSEELGEVRAPRGHETKFLVITSQKFIWLDAIEINCIVLHPWDLGLVMVLSFLWPIHSVRVSS